MWYISVSSIDTIENCIFRLWFWSFKETFQQIGVIVHICTNFTYEWHSEISIWWVRKIDLWYFFPISDQRWRPMKRKRSMMTRQMLWAPLPLWLHSRHPALSMPLYSLHRQWAGVYLHKFPRQQVPTVNLHSFLCGQICWLYKHVRFESTGLVFEFVDNQNI